MSNPMVRNIVPCHPLFLIDSLIGKAKQMKFLMVASALAALSLSPAAFAQTQNHSSSPQTTSQPPANSNQNLAAAQQIQQDLKKAGFTDVNVVAESFVVQAKSKDGNPVLMTIGPHGMSIFEAEAMNNATGSKTSSPSSTTGSAPSSNGTSK